ncbi:MAG: GNAT family N-acetyltransferase [Pseudomonadota bacterium]
MLIGRLLNGHASGDYRLLDSESEALLDHVRRLSGDQLYSRFMVDMDDAALVRWVRGTAFNDVIGWFHEGTLRATIEIGYRGQRAECGVTCEEPFRERRIGRQLFKRACDRARQQGATTMAMLSVCNGQRAVETMLDHPDWMVSRCYSRSIILPHAEPPNPLWLVRPLDQVTGFLDRILPSRSTSDA